MIAVRAPLRARFFSEINLSLSFNLVIVIVTLVATLTGVDLYRLLKKGGTARSVIIVDVGLAGVCTLMGVCTRAWEHANTRREAWGHAPRKS